MLRQTIQGNDHLFALTEDTFTPIIMVEVSIRFMSVYFVWLQLCVQPKKKKKKPLLSSSSLSKQIVLVVRFPSYKTFPLCSSRCNNQWYFISCRLNGLRWVKSDNLEAVSQVTQLDLRDNCLDSLDLSSISNLETLHCQRNQMGTLTLSGFTLRMLHASSNRESNKAPASCCYCLTGCLSVGSGPPPHSFYEGTYDGPDV